MADETAQVRKRVAVILVPGVGEEGPTETSEAVYKGLRRAGLDYERPDPKKATDADVLAVKVPRAGHHREGHYEANRLPLTRGAGRGEIDQIDLIEMRWSDISRFPTGLLSLFVSAFALGLQLATPGLEVTRGAADARHRRPERRNWEALLAYAANWLMNVASWLVAALLVPLTLVIGLVVAALWLVVDESLSLNDWFVVVSVALVGGLAVWKLGKGIREGGWSYAGGNRWLRFLLDTRFIWPFLPFLTAIGVAVSQIDATGSVRAGMARTAIIVGLFGLRPAWLGCLTAVGLALVGLALWNVVSRTRIEKIDRDRHHGQRRGFLTAVLTTSLSPLIVAALGTLLLGGISTVAFQSARDATWGEDVVHLRCLEEPDDWTWGSECGGEPELWSRLAGAFPARFRNAEELERRAREARRLAVRSGDPRSRDAAISRATEADALAKRIRDNADAAERDAGVAPVQWATGLLAIVLLPLGVIVVLLLALALGLVLRLRVRTREARGRGGLLTARLRWARGQTAGPIAWAGSLFCIYLTWELWRGVTDVPPLPWLRGLAETGPSGPAGEVGIGAAAVLALLSLLRFAPVDPRRWTKDVGGGLAKVRSFVDRGYDVATYLRRDRHSAGSEDGVRTRVVDRFRSVLKHVEKGEYDALVIAAHSQGSMYAIATLFGDEARTEPEPRRDGQASSWGVQPISVACPRTTFAGKEVALLTFGSPFRQTHAERLPGQYTWLYGTEEARDLPARLPPLSLAWVNAYRPRDFVGRAVFDDPLDLPVQRQGHGTLRTVYTTHRRVVRLVDVCLHGSGHHTGYWSDPELALWLHHLVQRALEGQPADPEVEGYSIRAPG